MVAADALNRQKETEEIIIEKEADYLLCVKDNHPNMKKDIEDFVQDETVQNTMGSISKTENNYGRIEIRTAYVSSEIEWLEQKQERKNLCYIGAIHTEFESKKENQMSGIIIYFKPPNVTRTVASSRSYGMDSRSDALAS